MRNEQQSLARKRLFKSGKPRLRLIERSDLWILWAGYDLGAFEVLPRGLSKQDFAEQINKLLLVFHSTWLIEDDTKWFKSGRGPIGLMTISTNSWRVDPLFQFFRWATPKSILKAYVMVMQKIRHDKSVGICEVRVPEKYKHIPRHMRTYGPLMYVGKIPGGLPDGDIWLHCLRGARTHSAPVRGEVVLSADAIGAGA